MSDSTSSASATTSQRALSEPDRHRGGRASLARAADARRAAQGSSEPSTFHALHYIGHGSYDRDSERGVLLFEDDERLGATRERRQAGDGAARLLVAAPGGPQRLRRRPNGAQRPVRGRGRRAGAARHSRGRRDAVRDLRRGGDRVRRAASTSRSRPALPWTRVSPQRVWRCSPSAATTSSGARRCCSCGSRTVASSTSVTTAMRRLPPSASLARRAARRTSRPQKRRSGLSIFLNYRPQDTSGHALLLTDRLGQRFGEGSVQGASDHGPESDAA